MKLREWKNRQRKDGDFYRTFVVSVPPELVKELGWKKCQDLTARVEGKKLVIEKQ
ncbi:MAG: AbrB/MazE/SpoVT family DNA-binding domain-containing protein [Thaumarchaeota archaeon]|nr:AbrB/MazE/SpoVT family DNA-binding domain-containing protein [Nitrososphaerota archaeon]